MPVLQAEAFWQFSLDYYARYQEPLLRLQDESGLNVNILLLCLYLQEQHIRLSAQQFAGLRAAIRSTEALLAPLRTVRRLTKAHDEEAYLLLQKAELALEKRQQRQLCVNLAEVDNYLKQPPEGPNNLQRYCQAEGRDPACLRALLSLLQG